MIRRALRPVALAVAPLVGLVACGAKHDAAGAAATAGLGVAAAGVYRATTKSCWAQCLNGLVCDHESGMCVKPSSCTRGCGPHERCEEGIIGRCVPLFERDHDASTATDAGADADAN